MMQRIDRPVVNAESSGMLQSSTNVEFAPSWFADHPERDAIDIEVVEPDLAAESPRCISVRLNNVRVKTTGFDFPESPAWGVKPKQAAPKKCVHRGSPGKPNPSERTEGSEQRNHEDSATRLRPPADIIKLQDRLYYLLQPPLQSLVGSGELTFPFKPFPYQFDGIAFLYPRYSAILADEMGLGKTMQAISTIRFLLCSGEASQILLICPKPLVSNWHREFKLWAPEIPVATIEGTADRRQWQWQHPGAPVKIANYEILARDRELVTGAERPFDLVVLDEAQRIKNRHSTTSQIVRAIPRRRSWALTGTPIENSPNDLVGIFEFLSPGFLNADMTPLALGKATKDYVLRRTKDKVLTDMPEKLYRDAELDLTSEQWATYEQAEDSGVIQLEDMGQSLTVQHVFELVLRLKQICNFDPATGASVKLERLVADMEEVAASGQKAIVFSQWVNSIDKMRPALERFGTLEYHGRIPHKRRETVIDQFKNDPDKHVILMSYGAGSVGLNLQFCRYVFLFDRWWNPAIEDQAINRAHRIGAAGSVTVTRMLAMNTIEQRIADVLDQKRELFETVFSDTATPRSVGLSRDDIFGLFKLRTPEGPMKS